MYKKKPAENIVSRLKKRRQSEPAKKKTCHKKILAKNRKKFLETSFGTTVVLLY